LIQKLLLKKIAEKALDKTKNLKNIDKDLVKDKAMQLVAPKMNKIESVDDLKSRALTLLFYGGVGFVSWRFFIKPAWNKYKLNKANGKVISDPNVQLASMLRQAIIGIGTNVTLVMEVAQKIQNWKAVELAYKNLTNGNNLNQDLHEDLSSNQYKQFMAIVNHNINASQSASKKGYIVISKKAVRLRSTPDSTISKWSFNSNILDTINAGKLLGFATGAYKTDSEGVLYYQVRIKYLSGIPEYHKEVYQKLNSRILSFWVGAGAISIFKTFSQMRASYPSVKIYKGTKDTGLRQGLK